MARWRVKVDSDDHGRVAVVFVTKRPWWMFPSHWEGGSVQVGSISLRTENADERLAEMRARAWDYAQQLTALERR